MCSVFFRGIVFGFFHSGGLSESVQIISFFGEPVSFMLVSNDLSASVFPVVSTSISSTGFGMALRVPSRLFVDSSWSQAVTNDSSPTGSVISPLVTMTGFFRGFDFGGEGFRPRPRHCGLFHFFLWRRFFLLDAPAFLINQVAPAVLFFLLVTNLFS